MTQYKSRGIESWNESYWNAWIFQTVDGPAAVYVFGNSVGGFNQKTIVRKQQQQLPISENQSGMLLNFRPFLLIFTHLTRG